jgi:porin
MAIRNLLSSRAPYGRSTRPLCRALFDTWTPLIQQVIHRRWRLILLALGASMVVSLASHARADGSAPSTEHSEVTISGAAEATEDTEHQERTISTTPETVDAQLAEANHVADALFDSGPLDPVHDLWSVPADWAREQLGLSLALNYTTFYQHATRARGANDAMIGDLDFLGRWKPRGSKGPWSGSVAFHTEWRHRLASRTPGQLGPRVGSQWSTAVSNSSQRFGLVELFWEQGRVEEGFIARGGKIDAALIYDGGRYVSQNLAFLSGAFSDSPAMHLPAAGLGAAVAVYPNDWLYGIFGAHDANARRTQFGFNSIDKADFYYAGEIGITPGFGTAREGIYHITGWRSEKAAKLGQPSGEGFRIHAEQSLGPGGKIVPFVRYGWASGALVSTKQHVATGVGLEDPLGRRDDLVGFGFGWGEPKRSGRDQYTVEAFYRVRITPILSLTPDAQVILNPTNDKTRDLIWLFSLRMRAVF